MLNGSMVILNSCFHTGVFTFCAWLHLVPGLCGHVVCLIDICIILPLAQHHLFFLVYEVFWQHIIPGKCSFNLNRCLINQCGCAWFLTCVFNSDLNHYYLSKAEADSWVLQLRLRYLKWVQWRDSSTCREIRLSFLLRVIWEHQYHSHVSCHSMSIQPTTWFSGVQPNMAAKVAIECLSCWFAVCNDRKTKVV